MERNDEAQGFRARAAQLLAWLTASREQERLVQTQQNDRQQLDGYMRGTEDPDNRRLQPMDAINAARQQVAAQATSPVAAEELQRQSQRDRGQDQRLLDPAELLAIRERLQAHHRALQQQQRGQGRGY